MHDSSQGDHVPNFLHTADWQIGLKAIHVAAVADRVRSARLAAGRAVIAAANKAIVDAVIVAGDLFEDNLVQDRLVHEIVQVLAASKSPVYVLPGNHDPCSQDSVYRRASWKAAPQHVVLLEMSDPVHVPGADLILLAAPLSQRKGFKDPTLSLAPPPAGSAAVVGVAHGSLRIEGKYSPDDFPIPLDAAARTGVDYLALGHWHGQYIHEGRTAYSGAHEPTSFGEANSGCALLVEIDGRGAIPRTERIETGQLDWRAIELDVSAGPAAFALVRAQIDALTRPADTLVRIRAIGLCNDDVAAGFPAFEEELAAKVLFARIERGDVPVAEAQGRLKQIAQSNPLVAALLLDLVAGVTGGGAPPSAASLAARDLLGTLALEVWQ